MSSDELPYQIYRDRNPEVIRKYLMRREKTKDCTTRIRWRDMTNRPFVAALVKIMTMRERARINKVWICLFFRGPSGQQYCVNNMDYEF